MRSVPAVLPVSLLLLLVTFSAEEAAAQVGYVPDSIEWMTASSDVVVGATVIQLSVKDRKPDPPLKSNPSQWATVTLLVKERWKGRTPEQITFITGQVRGSKRLSDWKNSQKDMIWFLIDRKRAVNKIPSPNGAAPGTGRWVPLEKRSLGAAVIDLNIPPEKTALAPPLFSTDLRVLTTKDQVLRAIKAEVSKKRPGVPKSHTLWLPREVAERTGKSGDRNGFTVPVDEDLEVLARQWVRSQEAWVRRAGAGVLRHFKNEKNVLLLKGLLEDSGTEFGYLPRPDGTVRRVRYYHVRAEAYATLTKWGVVVPEPELRASEESPRK